MGIVNAAQTNKGVADPAAMYESMRPSWEKSRAVINGQQATKDFDTILDTIGYRNMLIPFSPSMSQEQYNFYKAEAELPGIVSQYSRIIIGGLLRKQPTLVLPPGCPEEAHDWIMNQFTQDNLPLISFLDDVLWEEVQTSRPFVYIDYPKIENPDAMDSADFEGIKPYPIIWSAEKIINWRMADKADGTQTFDRIIVRDYEEKYDEPGGQFEFHPRFIDTVFVHELVDGKYQIRKFQKQDSEAAVITSNGEIKNIYSQNTPKGAYILVDTDTSIQMNGEPLTEIPAWPLNGSARVVEPMMTALIDREIALYNKISRRNHLLYGAATYTPYLASDMDDASFEMMVNSGLGSWLKINKGDEVGILETPTAALQDMEKSIAATLDEMAKLGIRMLTPDTDQSGVALQIRNAAQTSQLGTLNTKISNTMASVICFMVNWRYRTNFLVSEFDFELSADFSPVPIGADFIRLMTEWYEKGLIPRSEWLNMAKANDLITPDYDDDEGKKEINSDELIVTTKDKAEYQAQVNAAGAAPVG